MWDYKKHKKHLRQQIREQLRQDVALQPKIPAGIIKGGPRPPSILPTPGGHGTSEAMGPNQNGGWGIDSEGRPIYIPPTFTIRDETTHTPTRVPKPYYIPMPKGSGSGTDSTDSSSGHQIIDGEHVWIVGNWVFPAVEVPPGSGHWQIDQTNGPLIHDAGPPPRAIPLNGATYGGVFYGYDINCQCWNAMSYNSTTNTWGFAEPPNELSEEGAEATGVPDHPTFIYGWCAECGTTGRWVQIYPPDVDGSFGDDPTTWPDCESPTGCVHIDGDGNMYNWVDGHWVNTETGEVIISDNEQDTTVWGGTPDSWPPPDDGHPSPRYHDGLPYTYDEESGEWLDDQGNPYGHDYGENPSIKYLDWEGNEFEDETFGRGYDF